MTPIPTSLPIGRRSISWQVNSEPAVMLGGGRALLMQVAHPGVGYGVEQHSSYASNPWARLMRTSDLMMKLSYGTPKQVARQQEIFKNMHRPVHGRTDDGSRYNAFSQDLLLWVWSTLVDTAAIMYDEVRTPLRRDELERFYLESTALAKGCGVRADNIPASWGDFLDYRDGVVATDLRVTDAARAVAVATAEAPIPGPLGAMSGPPMRAVTMSTLPVSLREAYGFAWNSTIERRARRTFRIARAMTAVQPTVVRRAPARLAIAQRKPISVPWLERRGAELTINRLRAAGFEPAGAEVSTKAIAR